MKEAPRFCSVRTWGDVSRLQPQSSLPRNLTTPAPRSWTSSLQNHEKLLSGVYKAPRSVLRSPRKHSPGGDHGIREAPSFQSPIQVGARCRLCLLLSAWLQASHVASLSLPVQICKMETWSFWKDERTECMLSTAPPRHPVTASYTSSVQARGPTHSTSDDPHSLTIADNWTELGPKFYCEGGVDVSMAEH